MEYIPGHQAVKLNLIHLPHNPHKSDIAHSFVHCGLIAVEFNPPKRS